MTRANFAWLAIALSSTAMLLGAHELLSVHAVDTGMAGSLLGRPSLDAVGAAWRTVELLALRLALVCVAPGTLLAIAVHALVGRRTNGRVPSS